MGALVSLSLLKGGKLLTVLPLIQHGVSPLGQTPPRTFPWVLPTGCSPSLIASVGVSHGVTSPDSKPPPSCAPLPMGQQILPGVCSCKGCPWITASFVHPPVGVGPLHGLQGNLSCLTMGCSMGCIMGCRATSALASATPPLPLSLTLGSAGLLPSHILTPVSGCNSAEVFFAPYQIPYSGGATTVTGGLGLA